MFENWTYENILSDILAKAPPGIDIRNTSIIHDAVAAVAFKIAEFGVVLDTSIDLVFIGTATGEYLDRRGAEFNLYRNPAVPAVYGFGFTGTPPPVGERFFADLHYFTLGADDAGRLILTADVPGIASNNILSGTAAVPVRNLAGLTAAWFEDLLLPGANLESDDAYRTRIKDKIAGPAENGNRQHYRTWCESRQGVGRARIISLFAGPNSVMAVLIGTDGRPASQYVVDDVQQYIDPITLGTQLTDSDGTVWTVGDGLGDGTANIGAHFLAASAVPTTVDVSFDVELSATGDPTQVQADAQTAITALFSSIAVDTDPDQWVVRITAISAIIHSIQGVLDYSNLTLNGQTSNIALTNRQIPMMGTVTVNANI